MNKRYIDSLNQEQRAAWSFQVFIRLWLSGMCRSQAAQKWPVAQLAVLFEITQAHLFTDQAHTQTTLIRELGLTRQMVSRYVLALEEMGLIRQVVSKTDARTHYLQPANYSFVRDAMTRIARRFGEQWLHGWEQLDKAEGANWYVPMSECCDKNAMTQIELFKNLGTRDPVSA
jgi:predicted transcriptional regulator